MGIRSQITFLKIEFWTIYEVWKEHSHGILSYFDHQQITVKLKETCKYYFTKIEKHQRDDNKSQEN